MNNKITYSEALKLFKKYDKNKNGTMDIKEFKPAFRELISVKLHDEQIKEGFEYIDINKDGVVNFTEFWRYCQEYNRELE